MTDDKALAREMYAAMADGDRIDELIDRYMAEDFAEYEEVPGLGRGRDTPRQLFKLLHAAISGLHVDVQDMLQEGDKVAVRAMFRGTHTGELMGAPATGEPIEIEVIDILQFRGDQCVAHWGAMNMPGALAPSRVDA